MSGDGAAERSRNADSIRVGRATRAIRLAEVLR